MTTKADGNSGMGEKSYAQLNFEAYAAAVGGITYDGKPIPKWDDLTQTVRDGWAAGAAAVIESYDPDNDLGWGADDDFDDDSDYDNDIGD